MKLTHEQYYKVIQSRDARFDGLFFTAVKTTGIYCRPVCKVPAPKSENCTFYDSAEIAEAKGYRPCLRCRPELAPGYSEFEQSNELIGMILRYFEKRCYKPGLIGESAAYFGITSRHVNRLFTDSIGVSPQSFIVTKRLLMSKGLLTDTQLPITDIALLVGFGSVSRFNATFKKHYQLTPGNLRKKGSKNMDMIKVKLSYRPPYNWKIMMDFFRMRQIPGVEWVVDNKYRRTLRVKSNLDIYSGWIEVSPIPEEHLVVLSVSKSLEKVLIEVIKKVRRAFDLDLVPDQLPADLPDGIRLPGCFDSFEMGTRAILGQQITVKAAHTIATRLVKLLGTTIETPWKELNAHFPSAEELFAIKEPIDGVLGPIGVIKNRSFSIYALAEAMAVGDLSFALDKNPTHQKNKLLGLKGIGPWTAEYLTMRGMSWPDAFPASDIGVRHALMLKLKDEEGNLILDNKIKLSKYKLNKKYEKAALDYAQAFKPWRSYLTIALWYSLSEKE
ncbi:MAG: DNA-3-methyladenine glycosylase 2 family protein [Clostridiales bacterium]|nr:DNA-3-methyladenine glycosylase 2 family protein [Clostridiales bacterium]